MILGNPGRQRGWMSRHGHVLGTPDADGIMLCPESGFRYRLTPAPHIEGNGNGHGSGNGNGNGNGNGKGNGKGNGHGNGHDHPLDSTPAILRCLDLDEEAALPENLALGHRTYAEFKKHAVAPAG